MLSRRLVLSLLIAASTCAVLSAEIASAGDFVNFESAHVHPISLTQSGKTLYAVNTPEARLAKFKAHRRGPLTFLGDVPVGLEPVSLAIRPGTEEVWVVNHLSDTVSVIDGETMSLIKTLQVGDEPTDVVFASGRAFISLAGNEDRVVVYDAESFELVVRLDIFGDDPRALAVSPDGKRVALVVLESGNATTTVHQSRFTAEKEPLTPHPDRDPLFPFDFEPLPAPVEPIIVQFDPESGLWLDDIGMDWSDGVFFGFPQHLPDYDLFWIDAAANPPFVEEKVSRIGTTLFDVDIHPTTGDVWIPNTDSRNMVRFEPVLRGHLVETRISKVDQDTSEVSHIDLNPHINRAITPGPVEEVERSLAIPGDGVFNKRGNRYYLTAFGSSKVGVLDGKTGEVLDRIDVGGGPSGLALHPHNDRLYVMQRFSNTITIVNTDDAEAEGEIGLAGQYAFDPTPPEVREGRRFLYDAQLSSGHGDISCATCHVFGNFDGIAWDLGDPQGEYLRFEDMPWLTDLATPFPGLDPMKGPMVTQSLRGLRGTEPFHWRGDRENFQHFNGAFVSLLGLDTPLSDQSINAFTEFALDIEYPPNPYRLLDDTVPDAIPHHGAPAEGAHIFENIAVGRTPNRLCATCHVAPFGTNHQIQQIGEQSIEVAHLRNIYEKIAFDRFDEIDEPRANLKSGFGTQHHGSLSLAFFLGIAAPGLGDSAPDMSAFLVSFPSGTAPCVGHQLSVEAGVSSVELAVLIEQANLRTCDVVAKGTIAGNQVGFFYDALSGEMLPDARQQSRTPFLALVESLTEEDALTFMGVPLDSGRRLGIDRDRDGCLDGNEAFQQTDPANPGTPVADADGDGIPDTADLCPGWVQADHKQKDRNRNGIPNECECGDVSNDGKVNSKDVQLLAEYQAGDAQSGDLVLGKCNVAGAPGSDPALCDEEDLRVLTEYVSKGWKRARDGSDDLLPLCHPEVIDRPLSIVTCVDESLVE